MATRDDTDLERPRLPFAVYLVVGVLALIGLISISGFVFSTISLLIRLVIFGGLALLVLWGLKAIVFGSSRR